MPQDTDAAELSGILRKCQNIGILKYEVYNDPGRYSICGIVTLQHTQMSDFSVTEAQFVSALKEIESKAKPDTYRSLWGDFNLKRWIWAEAKLGSIENPEQ